MRIPHVTILGGGPAGLATGYFAARAGIPFTLYEAQPHVGGNAITHEVDGFRFDSGAHRLHDQDPEVTATWRSLLGDDLLACELPSRIFHDGMWVDFPLSVRNLLQVLPWGTLAKASVDLLRARLRGRGRSDDFESAVIRNYGDEVSRRFLLHYSQKLWGLPCDQLSQTICGARLKGLDLNAFLLGAIRGAGKRNSHLDGRFLYPRRGIGMLAASLANSCGPRNIRLQARVTRIFHTGSRIRGVEVNGGEVIPVEQVVSTLPLPLWPRLMDPAPAPRLLALANSLRFRHVVLVGIFINRPRITNLGTVYFVDPAVPMTRVYEPKNRSSAMAPADRTMLVAEIPCSEGDPVWNLPEEAVVALVRPHFATLGWVGPHDFLGACVRRIPFAYPVLERGFETKLGSLLEALRPFANLRVLGRNGMFQYASLHDMMRFGQQAVLGLPGAGSRAALRKAPPARVLTRHGQPAVAITE